MTTPCFKYLERYSKIYKNSRMYGSDMVLRTYLQLPHSFPVAASISHGVDVGHGSVPFDSWCIEPIHWCTNRYVYEKSKLIKPSVLMPHPWSMLAYMRGLTNQSRSASKERLIILPPPGPRNDRAIYEWWQKHGCASDVFLVKARQGYKQSIEYFIGNGIQVACIESLDSEFYQNLFNLLSSYESVVGFNAGSAFYFAASLGLRVQICDDFYFEACDIASYSKLQVYSCSVQKKFFRLCLEGRHSEASLLAQEILGFDLLSDCVEARRSELFNAYNELSSPIFPVASKCSFSSYFFKELGLMLGKPRLISQGPKALWDWFVDRYISKKASKSIIKINEFSCIFDGINALNFNVKPYSGSRSPGDGF